MKKTIQMFVESKPEIEIDSTEKCVCHNCGYEQEKMDNIKCGSIICPDCGMPLWDNDDPPSMKVRTYIRNQLRYLMMKDVE